MIPITQTKVVVKDCNNKIVVHGNCFAAVIASILELPIEAVPNVEVFYDIEGSMFWRDIIDEFLKHKGYELETDGRFKVFHSDLGAILNSEETQNITDVLYLASGLSPRGVNHICIYKNGELIHDPHPTREGLFSVDHFQVLTKIK